MRMERGFATISLLFLLFIQTFLTAPAFVSAQDTDQNGNITFPVVIWPLNESFKAVPYHVDGCVLYRENRTLGDTINSTSAVSVKGNIYVNCKNVTDLSIAMAGRESETEDNYTTTTVMLNIYMNTPFPEIEELLSENLTIEYDYYNESYALVEVTFSNLTVSPDIGRVFGSFDPAQYGWPREIKLSFLVNRNNGDSYLIDNGSKRYVGTLPLLMPQFDIVNYLNSAVKNAWDFVQEVKANPWVIENIINKAKMSSDPTTSSTIISNATLNFTYRIFSVKGIYLGLPIELAAEGNGFSVYAPMVNFWVTMPTPWVDISNILSNDTKEAIIKYIETGNSDALESSIRRTLYLKKLYLPSLFTNHLIATYIPPKPGDIIVLPLSREYEEQLNASYILFRITLGSGQYLHVKYDPRVLDPQKAEEGWKRYGSCVPLMESDLFRSLSDFMNDAFTTGKINQTKLDNVYLTVKEDVNKCLGQNDSEIGGGSLPQENTTPQGTAGSSSTPVAPHETSAHNKTGICGPAFLVVLSLFTLAVKRRG
ncbi:CGP-CTERM sorting domain-containing protein [Thermococcus waiotapuensis]|uniref:CGP-CTERM sorting domain-containing protein n=1 Tax=Thermococcus waiotapuensis TaxID=90909 RepID=A0AAE4NTZ5_9EURY|nr:CGP-CTERM sorting domain-containing protein [Thermococcus waiotapuensis]MDV3103272.1 CGP-CTERM sorting domain-containing protein [Thermococcus waiotapuensis]